MAVALLLSSCAKKPTYTRIAGFAQGTTYAITYEGADSLQGEVEALLARFDSSLSIYNPASIISKVNRNEAVVLDSFFTRCLRLAQQVSRQTNGAFDVSGAPLFEAWGFGSRQPAALPTARQVDSLRAFCGMDKFRIENNRLLKADPRVRLSANAVAKGYAVDVLAQWLEGRGKRNYLVEVGGEIFCRGLNPRGERWVVGIDRPTDGNFTPGAHLQAKVRLSGRGLATSGNYRRFYMHEGQKVAHTIDPTTGYPARSRILSATVLAPTCATADAFATALMVVGLDSARRLLSAHPELDACLIYAADGSGSGEAELRAYATAGFEKEEVR